MANNEQTLDKHLQCAVCFDTLRQPHTLKCLHAYCHQCIIMLQKNDKVQCPQCRLVTKMNDIKKDFRMEGIIDASNKTKFQQSNVPLSQEKIGKTETNLTSTRNVKVLRTKAMKELDKLQEESKQLDLMYSDVSNVITKMKEKKKKQKSMVDNQIDSQISKLEKHRSSLKQTINSETDEVLKKLKTSRKIIDKQMNEVLSQMQLMVAMKSSEDYDALSGVVRSLEYGEMKQQKAQRLGNVAAIKVNAAYPVIVMKGAEVNLNSVIRVVVETGRVE